MERVQRVWLVTDDAAPDPALLAQHPDLLVARVPREAVAGLPAGAERIYVIDPLGNLVLAFPARPGHQARREGHRAPAAGVADRINPAVPCKMRGLPDRRRLAAVVRRAHSR